MKAKVSETIKAIIACVFVFVLVVVAMLFKLEMYNGDPDCLFVKCVKVIK